MPLPARRPSPGPRDLRRARQTEASAAPAAAEDVDLSLHGEAASDVEPEGVVPATSSGSVPPSPATLVGPGRAGDEPGALVPPSPAAPGSTIDLLAAVVAAMASRHRDPLRLPLDLDFHYRRPFVVEFAGPCALVTDPPHVASLLHAGVLQGGDK